MQINQDTDALVVIDFQYDFAEPGGSLYVQGGMSILGGVSNLITKFKNVYYTQDNHPVGHASFASAHEGQSPFDVIDMYGHDQVLWPDHCIQGTHGAEIVIWGGDELKYAQAIVRKGMNPLVDSYSAFRENYGPDGNRATTGFGALLQARGIQRLFFVGLARDYCVRFSAEDAVAEGFEAIIIDSLTKSVVDSEQAMADVTTALLTAGVQFVEPGELEF